jgi:hypothetical protein
MAHNRHAGGMGRGGWHDHPREGYKRGGGELGSYTTWSHQDKRGAGGTDNPQA